MVDYLSWLLGESKHKNIAQITDNIIGYSYDNIHFFIIYAQWKNNSTYELTFQY